ncbi:hypothetical protein [Grimontia sp. AD028]|uniref:DUF6985 domain-containing protein n=1 Tax=Grimontia sp. AD028 TaxID=1581149 RepID=UPI0006969C13|nr:hypothetical protein [Grimontia sp. AD028]
MNIHFELVEDLWWQAKANLPSWNGFQSIGGLCGSNDENSASDGTVTVLFAPEGRDASPLNREEVESVIWVLENESDISVNLLESLLIIYPQLQITYGYSDSEKAEYMPDVLVPNDFNTLISLHSVNVHPLCKDGVPYIGFEFGCKWDEEHGLGVLMHGSRVVEIGGADTAILLWLAEKDAEKP